MPQKPELSGTNIAERVVAKLGGEQHGRRAENVLAYAGAAPAAFLGVLEALSHYGLIGEGPAEVASLGDVVVGLPWFNIIVLVVCVAPKTLGRATVGKYLDKLPFIGGK